MHPQSRENSERLKGLLLETFKFAQQFFKQHNLRYVACGGTVLGAVRHNGFIPWDDDIDIYMPREDYNRLLHMSEMMRPYGYEVLSYHNKGYYMPFAKISHMNSTIWEFKRLPFLMGAYIDIFPLDEFNDNHTDEEITKLQFKSRIVFSKYINAVSSYSVGSFFERLLHFDIHAMGLRVLNCYRKPKAQKYLQAFIDMEKAYSVHHGNKCVCVTQWEGKIFKREWFQDTIEWPFEDIYITIPRAYDAYLRLLYGDYMQLPPEEQRVQHPHYYVDLNHRINITDI
jgi:lipopolysaccharide cholinephosphotransferase